MRITAVTCKPFMYKTRRMSDSDGHAHPGPERDAKATLLSIACEDGTTGHVIADPRAINEGILDRFVRPILVGSDPMRVEALWQAMYKWQRGSGGLLTDRVLAAVDMALYDLMGRITGQPVYRLLGGYRDKILAYGSTMCGDDMEGGLATPADYGRFAEWLVKTRGYKAIKLHTWMPPIPGAPNVDMDYRACAAVREAVGPDIPLMLDPNHWYTRQDTLWLGKRLEELGFLWMEEPMEEASLSSYVWLNGKLDLPILGPETMSGKMHTRAEWAVHGACDMLRTGVHDVGGIGPSMKVAHLAESFNMTCEVHGTGVGNLAVALAIANTTYYERGLLHPFLDYEDPPAHLHRVDDPMDEDGYVHPSQEPGLGQAINFDYIEANQVRDV